METLYDIVSAKPMKDKRLFCQVSIGYGTLVWLGEIDIGPEDVWEFAERYT